MSIRPLLQVDDLSAEYRMKHGVIRAVEGVNFSVAQGEVLGIVGESGSGKSTLALALLGLLDPPGRITRGKIVLDGQDVSGLDEASWREIRGRKAGMVFQSPESTFNPIATIGKHLMEVIQERNPVPSSAARRLALKALDSVSMPRAEEIMDSYSFELSGGMCQRASLALALVLNPPFLIADEPTSSLDLSAQVEMSRLFSKLQSALHLSMIVISHDIGLISRLSNRVAVMYAGRIVEFGPASHLLRAPRHPYTQGLLSSLPRLDRKPKLLTAIPGHPAVSGVPAGGCAFAPRCNWVEPSCKTGAAPAYASLSPNWQVACIKPELQEEAPR